MEAIAAVESANGKYKVSNSDPSFGLYQMKTATAYDTAKMIGLKLPSSEKELKNILIKNDKIATMLACAYFGYLFSELNSLDNAIVSYNSGIGNVIRLLKEHKPLPQEYLKKVKKKMERRTPL